MTKLLDETRKDGQILADWLRRKLLTCGYAGKRCRDIADVAILVDFGREGHPDDIARLQAAIDARTVRELPIDRNEPASVAEIESDLYDHESGLSFIYHFDRAILVRPVRCHGVLLYPGDSCARLVPEELRAVIEHAKQEADERDEDCQDFHG